MRIRFQLEASTNPRFDGSMDILGEVNGRSITVGFDRAALCDYFGKPDTPGGLLSAFSGNRSRLLSLASYVYENYPELTRNERLTITRDHLDRHFNDQH